MTAREVLLGRHEETLAAGTPGVVAVDLFSVRDGICLSRNRHCALPGHVVPPLSDILLCAINVGRGTVTRRFGDREQRLEVDKTTLLINPARTETYWAWDADLEVSNLSISVEQLNRVADEHGLPHPSRLEPLIAGFKNPVVHICLYRAIALMEREPSRLLVDQLVTTMLIELWHSTGLPPKAMRVGGLASWQGRRVIEYLRAHLADEVTLAELADLAGLSTYHFARAFKQSTGQPPQAYLRMLRAERARELLETSDMSIVGIALEVGYESSQALARAFRREVGVSPTEYRRERRR